MEIIKRNLFTKLRADNFKTQEVLEPMSAFKTQKMICMMRNIADMPAGEVLLANPLLNMRLKHLQEKERLKETPSLETIYILRIIVSNVNATMNHGIPIRGIIQLGQYIRTRGPKVDYDKLNKWLSRLHISRMAQLQGTILINCFGFTEEELPFVKRTERQAMPLTIRTITNTEKDIQAWHFKQGKGGFVYNNSTLLRRNLRRSLRYYRYAPIEDISNFIKNFGRSLSEIEE